MDKESPDKISELSDDILDKILSSMSIRELARTSVLSTRWRNTWKSTSSLVFTPDIYNNYHYLPAKLARDVNRVFTLISGPIHKLELSCQLAIPAADIDNWVFFLSKHPIEELVLDVPNYAPTPCWTTIPSSSSSSESSFLGYRLKSPTDLATRLPQIRILNIRCILFEGLSSRYVQRPLLIPFANLHCLSVNVKFNYAKQVQALTSFLRSAPVLEELNIRCCQSLGQSTSGREWSVKEWDRPFACLRRIRVQEYVGSADETMFIAFMLLFSPVLDKMTLELIDTHGICNEIKFEIWKWVSGLERASPWADIHVFDPYGPPVHHHCPQPQALMDISTDQDFLVND